MSLFLHTHIWSGKSSFYLAGSPGAQLKNTLVSVYVYVFERDLLKWHTGCGLENTKMANLVHKGWKEGSCSVQLVEWLSSQNLLLESWRILWELLVFSLHCRTWQVDSSVLLGRSGIVSVFPLQWWFMSTQLSPKWSVSTLVTACLGKITMLTSLTWLKTSTFKPNLILCLGLPTLHKIIFSLIFSIPLFPKYLLFNHVKK